MPLYPVFTCWRPIIVPQIYDIIYKSLLIVGAEGLSNLNISWSLSKKSRSLNTDWNVYNGLISPTICLEWEFCRKRYPICSNFISFTSGGSSKSSLNKVKVLFVHASYKEKVIERLSSLFAIIILKPTIKALPESWECF